MKIPDENVKDVAIKECSNETKERIVDPTPSLTSSSKILVAKSIILIGIFVGSTIHISIQVKTASTRQICFVTFATLQFFLLGLLGASIFIFIE